MAERRLGAALALAALAVGVVGCGGGDASGATVGVYVASGLCEPARAELASHGATAGRYRVRLVCLPPVHRKPPGGYDLAAVGANARRATEDSSSVAYIEPFTRVTKFSRPILSAAGIPLLVTGSGREGMTKVLTALEGAGSSGVRESVREALEPS